MRVNVREGTARHDGPSLCLSCRSALVVRGMKLRDEIVQCAKLEVPLNRVTFPVTFCTGYVNRNHPSVLEMEELAWVLRSDRRTRQIGFVQAMKLTWDERHVLDSE